jgi:hypothetical protein
MQRQLTEQERMAQLYRQHVLKESPASLVQVQVPLNKEVFDV